jgi:signal transduction histidine kinase/CheY-like chemotaxis protein
MLHRSTRRVALPRWIDRTVGWFVRDTRPPDEQRTCRVIVGFTLTILAWSPLYAVFYQRMFPAPYDRLALESLAIGMAFVATVPVLIRLGVRVGACVSLLGLALVGLKLMVCSMTGGFRSPLLTWVVVLPVLGLGLGGIRMAWVWNASVLAQIALLASAQRLGFPTYDVLSPESKDILWGATIVSVTLTIFVLAWIYESIKHSTIVELERASEAKSEFLAHMSHEIRTPMTAILGFAEMLEEDRLSPEQLEHLATIRRNGEHLIAVINDILDLSRVEAGRLELEMGPTRPDLIVREVAALMEPRAAERGLELRVDVAPSARGTIRSDATRLRQVLINLAANAVKFTESGSVRLAVRADSDRTLRFDVADTGPGIPPEKIGEIFRPFTQVDASMSRRYGGTGLGLAISSRLAEALGGELLVESQVGRGSVFSLRVRAEAIPSPSSETPTLAGVRSATVLRGRVLIAEDGPDNRRLLAHLLERWGLEVEIAENGREALERVASCEARGEPIGLVLMDMQMPEIDGYEAARSLRARGFQAPIVALTAHAMEGSRDACLAAGCDHFLTKPVDRTQLRNALASFFDKPERGD